MTEDLVALYALLHTALGCERRIRARAGDFNPTRGLTDEPANAWTQATVLEARALMCLGEGRRDQAEALLRQSLEVRESICDPNDPVLRGSLRRLIQVTDEPRAAEHRSRLERISASMS